jgi:hypothetical protein
MWKDRSRWILWILWTLLDPRIHQDPLFPPWSCSPPQLLEAREAHHRSSRTVLWGTHGPQGLYYEGTMSPQGLYYGYPHSIGLVDLWVPHKIALEDHGHPLSTALEDLWVPP